MIPFILNIVKRCTHVWWSTALCPECLAFNKHREPRTQNDQKCAQEDLLIVWPAQSRSQPAQNFHTIGQWMVSITRDVSTRGCKLKAVHLSICRCFGGHLVCLQTDQTLQKVLWLPPCMQPLWRSPCNIKDYQPSSLQSLHTHCTQILREIDISLRTCYLLLRTAETRRSDMTETNHLIHLS